MRDLNKAERFASQPASTGESAVRPSEPSAPPCPDCKTQLRDETAWYRCDTCHARYSSSMERGLYRLPDDRSAAPQTSAENPLLDGSEHIATMIYDHEKKTVEVEYLAPQPVSGDAPDMNDPRYCGACKHVHPLHEVDCRCYCDKVSCPRCGPRIAARVMAGDAPKVEEIADSLIAFFNSSTIQDADIRNEVAAILRHYFPSSHSQSSESFAGSLGISEPHDVWIVKLVTEALQHDFHSAEACHAHLTAIHYRKHGLMRCTQCEAELRLGRAGKMVNAFSRKIHNQREHIKRIEAKLKSAPNGVAATPASHFTGVEPEYLDAANHGSDMTVEKLLDIVANGQTGKFGGEKLQQLADWIVAHRVPPASTARTDGPKYKHKANCLWATPLPTGAGFWGCDCGLDKLLLDLEDYEVAAPGVPQAGITTAGEMRARIAAATEEEMQPLRDALRIAVDHFGSDDLEQAGVPQAEPPKEDVKEVEFIGSWLDMAICVAVKSHAGQLDKSRNPYILHPLRVMAAVAQEGEAAMIAAVLHDAVEDTELSLESVKEQFGDEVASMVDSLSRRKGKETYREFIQRVKLNPMAAKIKIADLHDNLSRIENLAPNEQSIRHRYEKALIELAGAAQPGDDKPEAE